MMYNKTMLVSKKRICFYLKRYWWIFVVAFLIGIFALGFSISNRRQDAENRGNNVIYENKVLVTVGKDEKTSPSAVMSDCQVLLQTKDFEEQLNAGLNKKTKDEFLVKVELEPVTASDFCTLIVSANTKDIAEKTANIALEFLQERVTKYYPDSNLNKVEYNWKDANVDTQDNSIIQFRELLLFAFPIILAVFVVYFIMIMGKEIMTVGEANAILGAKKEISFRENEGIYERAWINCQLEKTKDLCIIISGDIQEFRQIQEKSIKLQDVDVLFLNDNLEKQRWCFVRPQDINRDSLIRFRTLLDLCGCSLDFLIFIQ